MDSNFTNENDPWEYSLDIDDSDQAKPEPGGAWVSTTNYVNAFGSTVTGCLGDIDNFLKKRKLEQVVAIVKSCSPNALGDLNVTLKDLSGTIHYKVLDIGFSDRVFVMGGVAERVVCGNPNYEVILTMRRGIDLVMELIPDSLRVTMNFLLSMKREYIMYMCGNCGRGKPTTLGLAIAGAVVAGDINIEIVGGYHNATASTSAFAVDTATPSAVAPTWTPGRASFIFPYLHP
ncbi:hypothetical protein Tco_0627090 [Tanacetum coccineum]|uniref:Uncharacterized protein n=1 Tax=Tanacetum coccineum TaxID=301880 RepID=A0ABQ4WLH9_9ASTR